LRNEASNVNYNEYPLPPPFLRKVFGGLGLGLDFDFFDHGYAGEVGLLAAYFVKWRALGKRPALDIWEVGAKVHSFKNPVFGTPLHDDEAIMNGPPATGGVRKILGLRDQAGYGRSGI
jgi:hypothetical protein